MKVAKMVVTIALIAILSAANAHAWGRREQGILIGASAALIFPSLIHSMSSPRYVEPVRYGYGYYSDTYYAPRYYAPRIVEQPPVIIYNDNKNYGMPSGASHKSKSVLTHRNAREHHYINRYRR